MLPTTKAVTALVLVAAGALALDGAAAVVTPAPSCGGDNPCGPQISAVPGCATSCIESAASNLGCVGDDYSCHCSKYEAIQGSAINCVLGACGLGGALGVPGAVGALCSCVTANPTTPCEEPTSSTPVETTTSTTAIETLTSTSTGPKPTPTPTCPGNECSFPSASEHECVASCIDAVLPEFGCNGVEDWNCYCTNFRKISSRSFACAYACGADIYAAFNNPASQGCSCLLKKCPPSSSSSSIAESSSSSIIEPEPTTTPPVPPTTTTPPPTSTCTHPCAPSITAIPACATSCIVSAASAVGCGNNDFPCRCASSAVIQQSAVGCVLGACALDEALRVVDAVGALCQCVTASPVGTGCGDGEGTATETGTGTGGVTVTSTSEGEGTETSTVTEGEGAASSGSFVTETRTVEVTTSVCDDDEETGTGTVTVTAGPTCSLGCDGDDGGSDGGDGGGDDTDGDGGDGDDEGGGSSPGSSPSSSPTGLPGGDNGGTDGEDDGGASGGGSTTTPKPPVETAGASNTVLAWTGSLVAMIAAAVALL